MQNTTSPERSPQSESDSTDFYASPPSANQVDTTARPAERTPWMKRKLDEIEEEPADKRQKARSHVPLPPKTSGLPCEIWQHIFSFVLPVTFPSIMQTCHNFNKYLTDTNLVVDSRQDRHGRLQTLHPDRVWQASRTRWQPSLPTGAPGCSEPELFKLLWSRDCQFCGLKSKDCKNDTPWKKGPGEDGVRRIWPFAVRSCSQCLDQRVQTFNSLMFSDLSVLLPAASFVFLTQDQHILSSSSFRVLENLPANVQIKKIYFLPQLENISSIFQSVHTKHASDAEALLQKMTEEREEAEKHIVQWEEAEATVDALCSWDWGLYTEAANSTISGELHFTLAVYFSGVSALKLRICLYLLFISR